MPAPRPSRPASPNKGEGEGNEELRGNHSLWPKKVFPAPLPRKPNGDEQNKRKGNLPLFETGAFFFAPKNKLPVADRRETQFKRNCPMRAEGPREGYTANKAGRKEHAQAIRRRECEQEQTRRVCDAAIANMAGRMEHSPPYGEGMRSNKKVGSKSIRQFVTIGPWDRPPTGSKQKTDRPR